VKLHKLKGGAVNWVGHLGLLLVDLVKGRPINLEISFYLEMKLCKYPVSKFSLFLSDNNEQYFSLCIFPRENKMKRFAPIAAALLSILLYMVYIS